MQDFLEYKDKIKSIKYDNGMKELLSEIWEDILALKDISVYEPKDYETLQTLTIDFGDCEFEIVGKVTWKAKAKEEESCSDM